jgi:hypothetical protein
MIAVRDAEVSTNQSFATRYSLGQTRYLVQVRVNDFRLV